MCQRKSHSVLTNTVEKGSHETPNKDLDNSGFLSSQLGLPMGYLVGYNRGIGNVIVNCGQFITILKCQTFT